MTAARQPDEATSRPGGMSSPGSGVGPTGGASPVDDRTYNLLQALTSKLEAIEAYEQYALDDDDDGTFAGLIEDERRHATLLLEALRRQIAA